MDRETPLERADGRQRRRLVIAFGGVNFGFIVFVAFVVVVATAITSDAFPRRPVRDEPPGEPHDRPGRRGGCRGRVGREQLLPVVSFPGAEAGVEDDEAAGHRFLFFR